MNSNPVIFHSHSHTLQFVGHDQDITHTPKGCTLLRASNLEPSFMQIQTNSISNTSGFNVFTILSRILSLKLAFKEIREMVMEVEKGISRIEV
jgi:hypothetical protein